MQRASKMHAASKIVVLSHFPRRSSWNDSVSERERVSRRFRTIQNCQGAAVAYVLG
jgi:hypothetical protein